jgi:hypothetical protein
MRKSLFPFFKVWLKHCVGLVFFVFATHGFGASNDASKDMNMSVRLIKQKSHLVFQVSIMNKTLTELRLGYPDCPITYVVRVEGKNYTFPEKKPFAPAKLCTTAIRLALVPPKSSAVIYISGMYFDLENALIKAKGNYSGEFRFNISNMAKKMPYQLIYKRQLRQKR